MSDVVPGQPLATTSGESVTELSTLLQGLSTPQQMALRALAEGKTHVEAAAQAGVSRTTLWNWLKTQPNFVAAYEAWQQELHETARARLLKATDDAAAVVTKAILLGDARIALRVLTDLGILRDAPSKKAQRQLQTTLAAPQPEADPPAMPESAAS
jgi:hypothetical protein